MRARMRGRFRDRITATDGTLTERGWEVNLITYRALDVQLNRTVAIKEYLPAALAVRHGGTQVLPRSTRLADDFRWRRDRFAQRRVRQSPNPLFRSTAAY